ncbi:FAD/NAD(P)-binding domain-containing protein [Ophiobolus disseminans]|uniref:FAD/NAD(P)-binding domain-containing protein n=1 Tax=Ophiobolus disseminans TaxID=1469910 RepID=A0A6A7ABQ5_9PLEO|nr:FAD/NAD(P)-binding domain-containing protein [Ophiobolus disseminans]
MKFLSVLQLLLSVPLSLTSVSASPPSSPLSQTWDFIIIGSGASGIPLADRLSETGKSVLLLERGWASSGRWGGAWKPEWLRGTNLSRFDVPGLAQLVWWDEVVGNEGVWCADVEAKAACLLGGGTGVNAGQFYLPTWDDFDANQPPGFRSRDVASALGKASQRLPWTDTPSMDGKSYLTNGSYMWREALTNSSAPGHFRFITANDNLNDRNRTSSWTEFFFQNGEKGGPLATYLVTASQRKNFKLHMNTTVARVLRDGDVATGVEVESTGPGGLTGTINVTPGSGRVILSAGVFGTFKILLRSGIGPTEEIQRLASHSIEAAKLPPRKKWINLPVGHNLDDGPNHLLGVSVQGMDSYPWETLWSSTRDNPDIKKYLGSRSGPLAQLQASIGPVSWDTVLGQDGRKRVIQWDFSSGKNVQQAPGDGGYMIFTSNLNLGHTSRGRLTLTPNLTVSIAQPPYFTDASGHDFSALLTSATSLLALINATILQTQPGSFFLAPPPGVGLEQYLRAAKPASSNHWVGTARMGERCGEGVVVDASTRVCGMRNLHVVDASVVNGLPTANPQAVFVVVAERAAEVIRGLGGRY